MTSDWNFHLEGHTVATASDPDRAATRVDTPVYSFVIDHPEGTILVDTGSHPDAGGLDNFDGTDTPVFVHEEERDRPLVQASTTRLSEEKRKVDGRDSQV